MKKTVCKSLNLAFLLITFSVTAFGQMDSLGLNNIFGKKGTVSGQVYRITFPRSDLKVKIANFSVSPGLALSSWIGIYYMDHGSMMMGDLVLLDAEEQSAVAKLVSSKLSITAIHNHLTNENPAIKYIHFSGKGDPLQLAAAIKSVLSTTGTPLTPPAVQAPTAGPDWSKAESILGKTGKHNGLLLQYSFPRKENLQESGMEMPPAMGMATAINFQMDGDRAATTGDFVLLADEVNPVIQALTENNIVVTAIHNHMLYDNPRLFMLHFWAVGASENLAAGLKAALDKTNTTH